MKNTKSFLLVAILIMLVVIFSIQEIYQVNSFKDIAREDVETILKTKAEKEAGILYTKLNSIGDRAASLALNVSYMKEMDLTVLMDTIEKGLHSDSLASGMGIWMEPYYVSQYVKYYGPYIYKDENNYTILTWEYSTEDYNYLTKEWYYQGLQKDKRVVFIPPYYDETLDTVFITCTSPIFKDKKIIGVTTAGINTREIQNYIKNINIENKGYAYIITSEGDYWGKNKNDDGNNLEINVANVGTFKEMDLGRHIRDTVESGIDASAYTEEIVAWAPIGDSGMKLVFHYPKHEYFEPIEKIMQRGALALVLSIVLFLVIINLILKKKIEEPLHKIISETSKVLPVMPEEDRPIFNNDEMIDVMRNNLLEATGSESLTNLLELQTKSLIAIPKQKSNPKANMDNMIEHIKLLLEERNQHIEELNDKNREILFQKEEITALYEETTAMNEELVSMVDKIENAYFETVRAFSNAIEANDKYTKGHCEMVAKYAVNIGKQMDLPGHELKVLEYAALLHDIGKIGVPWHILNKSAKLDQEELEIMRQHPAIGYDILKEVEFLSECVKVIYQHHERPDGTGYPLRIKGEDILTLSKIVSVADTFDAMTRARSYRMDPYSAEETCRILIDNSGKQFDYEVVKAFLKMLDKEGIIDISKLDLPGAQ